MLQTPEAVAFLTRVQTLSAGPVSLNEILEPSLHDEAELRRLFATAKDHQRLQDIHVGLVDVFDAPSSIRTTRARVIADEEDQFAKHIMPLSDANRRKEGTSSMVDSLEQFDKNWAVFTEGSLAQLDWSNVVAAGGSVQACLAPFSGAVELSRRNLRKHYHTTAYPSSDIDLFIWGLTAEQAEAKMQSIYETVLGCVPWDVTCVRTKHTISIHSQYPYRSIQIVLRLYTSPAEILAGFDIDAACFAYDGQRVWGNPRAIVSMMRQCNTVDMTRRSPSYEVRLAKYSLRGFEVYVPSLKRVDVDPTIYERSVARIQGLARLLVLEKLLHKEARDSFIVDRRSLRGRPDDYSRYYRRTKFYKGDLKSDMTFSGLEMNDYDVVSLHIPYGPGWHARRIEKLVYQTDLGLNSTFNPKNKDRKLHRHVAFFGTMEECIKDCCRLCPEPRNEKEKELQKEEDEKYIRRRISFIQEDPGRQSISGSFNPIDVGEWSEQTYIGPTEKLFTAIATHERHIVTEIIQSGHDVNRRDHVGRTALHLAIMSRATAIALDLIDAGARITPRLVDGRTALHLAAQTNQLDLVRRLLERSAENKEKADAEAAKNQGNNEKGTIGVENKKGTDADQDVEMKSLDDDNEDEETDGTSGPRDEGGDDSDQGEENSGSKTEEHGGDGRVPGDGGIPEDKPDEPDVLDINAAEWDFGFSPICFAILYGSAAIVNELLRSGANPRQSAKWINTTQAKLPPILLVVFRDDEDQAIQVAERLFIEKVSSATTVDTQMETVFQRAVGMNRLKLVTACLKSDPKSSIAIKFPALNNYDEVTFPVVAAIHGRHYSMLATLLAYGAKLAFLDEDIHQPQDAKSRSGGYASYADNPQDRPFLPVETALVTHDDVVQLLVALDAAINITTHPELANIHRESITYRRSLLDWVVYAQSMLQKQLKADARKPSKTRKGEPAPTKGSWKAFLAELVTKAMKPHAEKSLSRDKEQTQSEILEYFNDVKKLLTTKKAKTWNQIYPEHRGEADAREDDEDSEAKGKGKKEVGRYQRLDWWESLPPRFNAVYDELFEACFTGKNDRIRQLCSVDTKEKMGPLPLSVRAIVPEDKYDAMTGMSNNPSFTPLYAAIAGQKWETARLLMTLVAAQNKPSKSKFKVDNIKLDEDDKSDQDSDEDMGDDSENSVSDGGDPIDVTETPNRYNSSHNEPPERFLQYRDLPCNCKRKDESLTLLTKAIHDNDFQAFVHIGELYQVLPKKIEFDQDVLPTIIEFDREEMLDQFIRWTGIGVEIRSQHDEGEQDPESIHHDGKLYLGLDVHGKKRVDLARKNNPNAVDHTHFPLVWQACRWNAMNVLKYLQSDRPLIAYNFYSSSSSDSRAKQLKSVSNLEAVLPEWLGWEIGQYGDSPLSAALIGGKLDTVKWLFSKAGKLMSSALSARIKFTGYTSLMVAAKAGAEPQFCEFLYKKGAKEAERDKEYGWNIYHILADCSDDELLSYLLTTLPRPTSETLITQPSHVNATPLHVAVRKGAVRVVKALLDFTKLPLLTRDVDGFTPIHIAALSGFTEITQMLVEAAPADALNMENGVGATPLEITLLQNLRTYTTIAERWATRAVPTIGQLADLVKTEYRRWDVEKLEEECAQYSVTIQELTQAGKLRKRTKLATELGKFASVLEKNLEKARAAAEERPLPVRNTRVEEANHSKTLKYLRERLVAHTGERHLVHLIDVQKSVLNGLSKSSSSVGNKVNTELDGFEEEVSSERLKCMTLHYLDEMGPRGLASDSEEEDD